MTNLKEKNVVVWSFFNGKREIKKKNNYHRGIIISDSTRVLFLSLSLAAAAGCIEE